MAGTRLALSIVFLIEIPLLILFAIHHSLKKSSTLETKWYPTNQPFLPHRSGISLLRKHDANSTISRMRSIMNEPDFKINVEFHVRFLGTGLDASERDEAFHALVDGVNANANDNAGSPEDPFVQAKIQHVQNPTGTAGFGCHESDFKDLVSNGEHHGHGGYNIFIASECQESATALDIGEDGTILVRLPKLNKPANANTDWDVFSLDVPSVMHYLLHSSTAKNDDWKSKYASKPKPSTSQLRLVVTVVDPDPSSHGSHSHDHGQTAIQHSQRLNQILAESLEEMQHMFEKLGPLRDVTVSMQNLPYHGHDLSSDAIRSEYSDGTKDYIALADNVEEYLLYGDLSHLTEGFVSPDITMSFNEQEMMQLILFVPEGGKQPMYIETAGPNWGTAFSMPEKNLAVSIVNLPDIIKKGDEVEAEVDVDDSAKSSMDAISLDDSYKREIQKSLSYFGTFLREHFGLSPRQPHSVDISSENTIVAKHARAKHGVALWEVESLMRNTMHWKAEAVLSTLEQVDELIFYRPSISLPEKVRGVCQDRSLATRIICWF